MRIDDLNGEAEWAGQDLRLTRREREVLHALANAAGSTMRREVLYKRVWGYAMAALAWRTARQPAVRHREVMSLKRIETFWLWLCEWKARPITVRDLLNGFQD